MPPALIQSLAAFTRSSGGTIASMSFIALARSTLMLVALEQELQRVGGRQHARDARGAAGAGKQPDLDFRQAEARLRILRGDAVVAGERELEAAAERGAVDGGDPRLAAGLDPPIEQRELAAFLEQARRRLLLAVAWRAPAKLRPSDSSSVRSAPAQNVSLPEVITTPLTAASPASCSTSAASSSMPASEITFIERPGTSQVTSAMPSPSMSTLKLT